MSALPPPHLRSGHRLFPAAFTAIAIYMKKKVICLMTMIAALCCLSEATQTYVWVDSQFISPWTNYQSGPAVVGNAGDTWNYLDGYDDNKVLYDTTNTLTAVALPNF